MLLVLNLIPVLKQLLNVRRQINRGPKLNLLFLQRYDQSQKFCFELFKNRQKTLQRD